MSSEERNLDRVRQILKRMERSIDDARSRRLREHSSGPAGDDRQGTGESATPAGGTTTSPASPSTAAPATQPSGPIRFDEDGRPIVGRAKPKGSGGSPQGGSPYSPGGGSWR
jgi:hypothetical protein